MTRIVFKEYDNYVHVIKQLSKELGVRQSELRGLFNAKGLNISNVLGIKENPIKISEDSIRVIKIAGVIRICSGLEVEIIPKFLDNSIDNSWREDFFFLAMISKYGRLLDADKLSASLLSNSNLDTILAKIMIDMYNSNSRRPIRTYNKCTYNDFSISGDFEAESILFPNQDGFEQYEFKFNKQNRYNAIISKAISELNKCITEPAIILKLNRIIHCIKLEKGYKIDKKPCRVPSRNSNWQGLYSMSLDILKGNRLNLKSGQVFSPGYVIDTWRVWEDFLNIALGIAFGHRNISVQKRQQLGMKYLIKDRLVIAKTEAIVKPDIIVYKSNTRDVNFIIDAKYKAKSDNKHLRISQVDLYEGLAFLNAVKCNIIFLAYPSENSSVNELGNVNVFEVIQVGAEKVVGVQVNIQGISQKNGLSNFSNKFKEDIEKILKDIN